MLRRIALIAPVLIATACGGSSPTTPTPAPLPTAKVEAVVEGPLELPFLEPGRGWMFTGKARNSGQGCATTVRGTARFQDAAGAALQTVEFNVGGRFMPGQVVDWQACCLSEANGRLATAIRVDFTWQDVAC